MTNTSENQAAPVAEAAEIVKDTANGVTRPGSGTATGKVWEICDVIFSTATPDNPITRSRVIKTAEAEEINVSTAATQYGRWRKYMGLEREAPKAVKPVTEAAPKAKKVKPSKAVEGAADAAPVVETNPALAAALDDGVADGEAEATVE